MQIRKNLILAVLILSFSLFTGWTADQVPLGKDLSVSFSPDSNEYFSTKRADIKGMAYQLYQMLIEAGRGSNLNPVRSINIKSPFNVMNL